MKPATSVRLQSRILRHSNEPAEEKKVHDTALNALHAEKGKAFTSESRLKRRNNIRERALAKSGIGDVWKPSTSKDKKVAFSSIPSIPLPRRTITLGEQPREIPRKSSSSMEAMEESLNKKLDDSDDAEDCSFASDRAECSSPESPSTEVLPVIDEYNPLLEAKPPELPLASPDDSDVVVESSDRSVDGSNDSETENQEETPENEKEHGTKPFVAWTEDDEKNLMDLGTSELERNQRLESLIARRRARRCVSSVTERNLIDFDSNDPPVQAPCIKPVKNNPFDAPYNSSESDGLPPVPGSAPSVLVPRGNPFDLPYDPQEEKPNLKEDSFQLEFTSVFCRHESFNYSPSSFKGGLKHDRFNTKYTPYIGAEGTVSSGNDNSGSSTQLRERRHSVFEQLPPIDRKNHKKQMERVLSLGVYPSYVAQERIIPEMSFFKPYNEVKTVANITKVETKYVDEEKYNTSSISSTSEIKEDVVHVEHSQNPELASTSETKEEVPEQASTSDTDDEAVEVKDEEFQFENIEPVPADDSNRQHGDSQEAPLSSEDSDNDSRMIEGVDEVHIKEPVYDSSPTAVEKRTIDEYLIYSNKGQSLIPTASEAGSPRESLDRYTYADGESSCYDGNDKNAIVSGDNAVEEKELRPIEDTRGGEHDAIKFEAPTEEPVVAEQTENDSDPVSELIIEDRMDNETLSSEEPEMAVEVLLQGLTVDRGDPPQEDRPSSAESQEAKGSHKKAVLSEDNKIADNPVSIENSKGEENNPINKEVYVDPPQPVEATVDAGEMNRESTIADVKEHNRVHETAEALTNISKPSEATMVDAESSDELDEVSAEAMEMSVEASKVHETKDTDEISEKGCEEDVALQKSDDKHA